jgi:hypothetical protein
VQHSFGDKTYEAQSVVQHFLNILYINTLKFTCMHSYYKFINVLAFIIPNSLKNGDGRDGREFHEEEEIYGTDEKEEET